MTFNCYILKDTKAGYIAQVLVYVNEEVALRELTDLVAQNKLNHYKDLELYQLATLDIRNAQLTIESAKFILSLKDLKNEQN